MFAFNISLNYSGNLIDFYDWEEDDNIVLVKKMPLFLISSKSFNDLLCNKVNFSEKFYNIIKNKCELYDSKKETSFIVSDGKNCFSIKVDKNKNTLIKSFLDILDEAEIVELANNLSVYKIDYIILNNDYIFNKFTRKSKIILDEINRYLIESKNISGKLEYLYYEWFGSVCCSNDCFNELYASINSNFSEKHNEFLKELEELSVNK